MGKEEDNIKQIWWNNCFNKIYKQETVYIPIDFNAQVLKF